MPLADLYAWFGPVLRMMPPEAAHRVTIRALAAGLLAGRADIDDPVLQTRAWGLQFPNPIGLAAGFDKDAEVFMPMLRLGFGFVEVGSITPRPQPGNPRPRVFRLAEDRAVINRLGFNSAGLAQAVANLRRRAGARAGVVGVNLGKNGDSSDAAADYAAGATAVAPVADYLVVNVSSPNTPGLRALQEAATLRVLLDAVRAACRAAMPDRPVPLLLKIAPDLAPADRVDISRVALDGGVDGLIISNTTIDRPGGLRGRAARESGGLSGRPLFGPSTDLLREIYRLTGGQVPLVGVGGVASGADAYAKIRAGASLVQLYTALIYEGPSLVGRIKRDLASRLHADGFASVAEAVGADHR
jgi:dihydroorotate dehydrogenase